MTPPRAVIYVPRAEPPLTQQWLATCVTHCEASGYDIVHTVVDGQWPILADWLITGRADIIVTAEPDHLPADRTPRVETARDRPAPTRWARRPRRVR